MDHNSERNTKSLVLQTLSWLILVMTYQYAMAATLIDQIAGDVSLMSIIIIYLTNIDVLFKN